MDFVETEGWRDIESFDSSEWVRLAAIQALEAAGITVPNLREEHVLKQGGSGGCFGVALEATQERLPYRVESGEGVTVQLPRFFVEAVQFLEQNTDCEGIFRKAGSVARQKNLRLALNAGVSLNDCNVHDVASLLKQYLRELPQPLIPSTLTPALDSCLTLGEREGRRCLLLVCLLLPSAHLQCLRVLVALLSHVACRGAHSLMNADSLAVVMAPNLLRPQREVLSAMDASIRAHTAVAKMLIESSNLIGQVPADIIQSAQMLANEMADCPKDSSCNGVPGEGGSGEETTGRYQKWRKRTGSLSGLVMGLGNRLKSKGGRAPHPHTPAASPLPGGRDDSATSGHVTKVGRMPSFKRKGSHEDLLANKRPTLAPPPSLSHRLLRTPLISHHRKKALLGRRRHTDQVKSPHTSRLPLSQNIFKPSGNFKFDFAKQATNRSPEKGCGLEGVATPGRVQLVGFTALHKARKLLGEDSTGTILTEEESGLGTMATEQEVGVPNTVATDHRKVASVECLNSNKTDSQKELVSMREIPQDCIAVVAASHSESHSVATVISEKEHVYRSQLLAPGATPVACVRDSQIGSTRTPLPPTSTGRRSSAKRMRCDTEEDREAAAAAGSSATRSRWDIWMSSASLNQAPSTNFTFKPPGGIRGSQSDHQLGAYSAKKLPTGFRDTKDSPRDSPTRPRIPTSLSHPSFPLSLPCDRRQDDIIQGSEVANLIQTPQNAAMQDSSSTRFHQSSSAFKYTFSNPRPVKSTATDARANGAKVPGNSDDANSEQDFESSRKISDSNEATWLDGVSQQSLSSKGSSPAKSGGGVQPNTQISDTPLPTSLDEGFLQTPCLPLHSASRRLSLHTSNTDPPIHSPNLLEKISHEIAKRHKYSPSTPCLLPDASVQVNDSYKQAVLGNHFALSLANPMSLQFDTSLTETSQVEDGTDTSVTGEGVVQKSGMEADVTTCMSDTKDALESEETTSVRENKLERSCTHTTIEADLHLREEASTEVAAESRGVSNSYSHNLQLCHYSTKSTGMESKPPKYVKLGKAAWHFATPKAHHKKKPEGGRWSGMPSPSPRGFSFSLPSPFSRGNTAKEPSNCGSYKLSKRAQLYMVSSPTTESLTTCSPPSSIPHSLPTPPPHKPLSPRLCDKENWCAGGSMKVCPSRIIQVREWVV